MKGDNFNFKYQLQNLKYFFDRLIKLFKRMIKHKDKEKVYLEVLKAMHDNKIINNKICDGILGYNEFVKK